MEGTIDTPVGKVDKKTAVWVGAGAVVVLGVGYYRYQQTKKQNASVAAAAGTSVDPATGYDYGSAEDAAALGAQGNYIIPTTAASYGGGGSAAYPTQQFTSNAQWTQTVVAFLQSEGLVSDPTALLTAIGRYLAGQPLTADQVALVQQAVAVEGYPPVSGPTGFPPSMNTSPTTGTGGTGVTPSGPIYGAVEAGYHVDEWIDDTNSQHPGLGLAYDKLVAMNPSVPSDILWRAPAPGYPGTRNNVFKYNKTYRIG